MFTCGSTGTGKSHYIKSELERLAPDRSIIVDPDNEYGAAWGPLFNDTQADRLALLATVARAERFRVRFRPNYVRAQAEKSFAWICGVSRWLSDPSYGRTVPRRRGPLVFTVDELADFVGSSFRESPDSWQWMARRGRKYGVSMFAASQRPAMIEKTFFDLATVIRVHFLNNADSQKVMAKAVRVPVAWVEGLGGYEYLQRDNRTRELTGKVPDSQTLRTNERT